MLRGILLAMLVAAAVVVPKLAGAATDRGAAPSATSLLSIVSTNTYDDPNGNLVVVGELRNISPITCGGAELNIGLYTSSGADADETGTTSNTITTEIDSSGFDPGKTATFHIAVMQSDYPDATTAKVLSAEFDPGQSPGDTNFSVSAVTVNSVDSGADEQITGTVTNHNNVSETPDIVAVWHDQSGKIIDTEPATQTPNLPGGASGGFTVDDYSGLLKTLDTLSFQFSTTTDPSPMTARPGIVPNKTIVFGRKIEIIDPVLKGRSAGNVPAGLLVALQQKVRGTWRSFKTVTTDATGVVTFEPFNVPKTTTFRLVTLASAPTYLGATSKSWTIKVSRGLRAYLRSKSDGDSVNVRAQGQLGPDGGHQPVEMQVESDHKWSAVAGISTSKAGDYTIVYAFTKPGYYSIRLFAPAYHGLKAVHTPPRTLHVYRIH